MDSNHRLRCYKHRALPLSYDPIWYTGTMKSRLFADLFGLILWLALVLLLYWLAPFTLLHISLTLSWAWQLFIELNIATFLLFGFDKLSAQVRTRRISERILYLATFCGGSIGALVAMNLFRHKTRKLSFQLVIALLILIQIIIVLSL